MKMKLRDMKRGQRFSFSRHGTVFEVITPWCDGYGGYAVIFEGKFPGIWTGGNKKYHVDVIRAPVGSLEVGDMFVYPEDKRERPYTVVEKRDDGNIRVLSFDESEQPNYLTQLPGTKVVHHVGTCQHNFTYFDEGDDE